MICRFVTVVIAVLLLAQSTFAATWHVDATAPANGDGQSWATAFNHPQEILQSQSLQADDIILVAQGEYRADPSDPYVSFVIDKSGIKFRGGYIGYAALPNGDPYENDPEQFVTILGGYLYTEDDVDYHSLSVVRIDGEYLSPIEDVEISGFSIAGGRGGWSPGPIVRGFGAGIQINFADRPVVRNCRFSSNAVPHGGAGVYSDGDVEIRSCWFHDNSTGHNGAGAAVSINSGEIINSLFEFNTATYGGAIATGSGTVQIINCRLRYNEVNAGKGGAVDCGSGLTRLINCLIHHNEASAGEGGGIYLGPYGEVEVLNCTIAWNQAGLSDPPLGGGIHTHDFQEPANCRVQNTILHANYMWYPEFNSVWSQIVGPAQVCHSLVQEWDDQNDPEGCEGTNFDDDPEFFDDLNGDYRLQSTSPAINMGSEDNDLLPADAHDVNENGQLSEKTPDLDFCKRISGPRVDMGAYEYLNPCPADINQDGLVNTDDLLNLLAQWGNCSNCSGDLTNAPCGDGLVTVDDLLILLADWGTDGCPSFSSGSGPPQDILDCQAAADSAYPEGGEAWLAHFQECISALSGGNSQ